jgi:periplasmic divalent cation tolerance protein
LAEASPPARIVLTTTASPEEAARLGRTLVEERLVACATLIPAAQSIYRWQGQIESST